MPRILSSLFYISSMRKTSEEFNSEAILRNIWTLCGDSLYACEGFFEKCREKNWRCILWYKEGSIPTIGTEYRKLKGMEKNYQGRIWKTGKEWHDYVTDIDYKEYKINLAEYGACRERICKKGRKKGNSETVQKEFWFLTGLISHQKNVTGLVKRERMR